MNFVIDEIGNNFNFFLTKKALRLEAEVFIKNSLDYFGNYISFPLKTIKIVRFVPLVIDHNPGYKS